MKCFLAIWITAVVSWLLSGWLMHYETTNHWQRDAEATGHAEYYLDADHARQWRWKVHDESEAQDGH